VFTGTGSVSLLGNTGFPLSALSFGDVVKDLTIANNHGFSDDDAKAFAKAHNVTGTTAVGGNTP
jgi:hypothetical protein